MKTLDNIEAFDVETSFSWHGELSRKQVKTSFIRPDGQIVCRSNPGDRFMVVDQIAELRRLQGAGKGWQIDEITEREHKEGLFTERTYSGKGLDYLFEP